MVLKVQYEENSLYYVFLFTITTHTKISVLQSVLKICLQELPSSCKCWTAGLRLNNSQLYQNVLHARFTSNFHIIQQQSLPNW